jgi:RNA polymerase sigma factor (sigma-70 family)
MEFENETAALIGNIEVRDFDQDIEEVIGRFALLIKKVIRNNTYCGDGIDLEDIEQEIRLKIWKFLKKGKKVDNLASYIKKVAYSTTIDELRRMRKQRPSQEPDTLKRIFLGTDPPSRRDSVLSPEACLERDEARQSIGALVDTLSEDRKKVLTLFLAGMSIEEISISLSWDKSRIRHLYYRGIDDLKSRSQTRRATAAGDSPDRQEP